MANRNVNKVILVGNLTRDPELRYTPQGTAVANFTVATNRAWKVDGVEKEAVDFHNIVAWNKLGELCGQLLKKGTMVYLEGRLQNRSWTDEAGNKRTRSEVNIDEMIVLKQPGSGSNAGTQDPTTPANASDDNLYNGDDVDIDQLLNEIDQETGTQG